jgi:hypothetical protein
MQTEHTGETTELDEAPVSEDRWMNRVRQLLRDLEHLGPAAELMGKVGQTVQDVERQKNLGGLEHWQEVIQGLLPEELFQRLLPSDRGDLEAHLRGLEYVERVVRLWRETKLLASLPPSYPDILTLEETAGYLQLNPALVERLARTGQLPGRFVADQWRFSKQHLAHWAAGHAGATGTAVGTPPPIPPPVDTWADETREPEDRRPEAETEEELPLDVTRV